MTRRVGIGAVAATLLTIVTLSASAAAHSPASRVKVKPKTGVPTTKFVISFRAPDKTGTTGSMSRHYIVAASASTSDTSCVSSASTDVPPTAAHQHVHVTLDPHKFGGKWCIGKFKGRVEEISSPTCPPKQICPLFAVIIKKVGTFSFRVKAT